MNDRWIAEVVFPGLRAGYFLEVGAADGIVGSSCYVLEKELGWRGICIEGHPGLAQRLPAQRPGSLCFPWVLSGQPGEVDFVVGGGHGPLPFLSGVRTHLENHKSGADAILRAGTSTRRRAALLADVLAEAQAPALIDYAAFDIEGSELPVLESFPFDRYRFRALSLECDWRIWHPITDILSGQGYREVHNPFNRIRPWERYWLGDAP